MKKILIVAPSWIGDAVIAQPLFRRLHERHPGLTLEVLAPPWTQGVFAHMPEINAINVNPFGHGEQALGQRRALAHKLAASNFEQAIVLPNSFKSALIPRLARIPVRTGYVGEARWFLLNDARRLDKQGLPLLVERYALLAEEPGEMLHKPLAPTRLAVDPAQRDAAIASLGLKLNRPIAVLCPGAEYGPAKRWPAAHFAALADRLSGAGYDIWLIGSAKDSAGGEEIARTCDIAACVNLCGRTSLAQAIDLMSCATLVVSNDSGLMHVAAALDKPLTALFGSSSPAYTPPLSSRARVVGLNLECSPCFRRECPLGHFNCMRQLDVEKVWRQIQFDKISA